MHLLGLSLTRIPSENQSHVRGGKVGRFPSWAYSSPDLPGYDSALYYTDDTGYVPLADTSGASGTVSFTLSAGEYMGFSVESLDSSYGPGALTIRDFEVEAVPEPATMAALGLGLAAVSRRRRK